MVMGVVVVDATIGPPVLLHPILQSLRCISIIGSITCPFVVREMIYNVAAVFGGDTRTGAE